MEEQPRLWKQILVQQLSQYYHEAMQQIYNRNLKQGKEAYLEMLKIYKDIRETDISLEDKQVAHFCVQTVYDTLKEKQEEPPISESTFRMLFSISILILLIGLAIVLKPSVVGLVAYGGVAPPEFIGVQTRFFITSPFNLDLDQQFRSADGNELEFLVTRSPTVDVEMQGAIAKFIPSNHKGISRHTLMAISKRGSTYEVTRVPIEIIVQ